MNHDLTGARPSPWSDWPLDREVVITRLVDAPRAVVYAAWTDPAQLPVWFGPEGFAIETQEIEITPGGCWRFDMVAPDGTRFTNRMVFRRLEAPALIEVDHGSDIEDDPAAFRMLVTLDAQANGKTIVTLRQMHPTAARRAAVIGFGAFEYGGQTLDKLARHAKGR
ncbi:MAG TPA: SRPBCC family protein [Paracoccaceae bacterium]|mgnify:CR=1 FL=1|nr:SRPBCC family protein [Paracoccaceae bacterium]HMO70403.1 SRPBCC family protein [Paracoccaceae bacterium]